MSCEAIAAMLTAFSVTAQPAPMVAGVADRTTAPGGSSNTDAAPPTPGDAGAAHPDTDQAIVVTGVKRSAGDILGGISVVDKELLQHKVRPSIGETLASQPGVTASSFGPTASRPILRQRAARAAWMQSRQRRAMRLPRIRIQTRRSSSPA